VSSTSAGLWAVTEKALAAFGAVRLPLRQAVRARVCRSIVLSRRQKRRGNDRREGIGRGWGGSRQSVDVEAKMLPLLCSSWRRMVGHWQNIRRIRKAQEAIGHWAVLVWGPTLWPVHSLEPGPLIKTQIVWRLRPRGPPPSSTTHSRAHFIVGELERCLAKAGWLLRSGSSLSCAPDQCSTPIMEVCESQFGSMCNASYRRSLHPNRSRDPDE
jgi:hypothetical protein